MVWMKGPAALPPFLFTSPPGKEVGFRHAHSRFHCCPCTEFTTHCNQCILQGKPATLLLNGSQTSNGDLESKVSRVLISKQIKRLKYFVLLLQDHEIVEN